MNKKSKVWPTLGLAFNPQVQDPFHMPKCVHDYDHNDVILRFMFRVILTSHLKF